MTNMPRPVRGQAYTPIEMETLYTRDEPFLMFYATDGSEQVIQSFPLEVLVAENHPLLAERFTYAYETEEWIPIFYAVDDAAVRNCVQCVVEDSSPKYYPTGHVPVD